MATSMEANEKIRLRREHLGLSKEQVAASSGIGVDAYYDIEFYSDELLAVVALRSVKALCDVVGLNPLQLLDIKCAFCSAMQSPGQEYSLLRSDLIKQHRVALGLSTEDLGERVNYTAHEIECLEADPEYIENWRLKDILALSSVLALPPQVLMQVHCEKCTQRGI